MRARSHLPGPSGLRGDRERGVVPPLVPGADVHLHVLVPGLLERQVLERSTAQADGAIADDGLGRVVPVLLELLELLLELGLVLQGGLVGLAVLVAGVLAPGREDRGGDGAAPLDGDLLARRGECAGAGSCRCTRRGCGGSRGAGSGPRRRWPSSPRRPWRSCSTATAGVKVLAATLAGGARLDRAAVGLPGGQPSVEDADVLRAVELEEEPGAAGVGAGAGVVDHHLGGRVDPQRGADELGGGAARTWAGPCRPSRRPGSAGRGRRRPPTRGCAPSRTPSRSRRRRSGRWACRPGPWPRRR